MIIGNFHSDENYYTYDHIINTDSPNKKQLKTVLEIIKKDQVELIKVGKQSKLIQGDTVPYLEIIE